MVLLVAGSEELVSGMFRNIFFPFFDVNSLPREWLLHHVVKGSIASFAIKIFPQMYTLKALSLKCGIIASVLVQSSRRIRLNNWSILDD
jgi:hypothetical protein